jgi:signal transduction histidine kinase
MTALDALPSPAVVMVVDDQEANVRAVGALLAREGFDVVPCFSGAEAIAYMAVGLPDVVLLDMRMPGMDGVQVLSKLRADPRTLSLPVIFLTADHDRDSLVLAFNSGAVDYVTKPFVPAELLARVRTHAALKRASDQLQKLAQERQDSMEIIAHDLRNHFTNILFASDLLEAGGLPIEKRARLGASVRSSAHAGLAFLQAVLDQATGEVQGQRMEPLPAAQVVQDALDEFAEQALAKEIRFKLQLDRHLLVRGQRLAMGHVLKNLISNAIKYGPRGSTVTVSALRHEHSGRVRVMDQGAGVAEHEERLLFQRFASLSSQPTGGESSTGLGLALAKQQARALGGDLWYERSAAGGACFTLELPRVE